MNKITKVHKELKNIETSCKALGAAMFMFIVCLYMAIGALTAFVGGGAFYYHVTFSFLIQGIAVSMIASTVWVLCFSFTKPWGFIIRYAFALIAITVLFTISMLIPAFNMVEGHLLWVISGVISTLSLGTAVAVSSYMHLKKTGLRSAVLWEIS